MKVLTSLLVLLALLLRGPAAGAVTVTITVGDNFYLPQLVTIHAGDVVAWHYQGGTNSHPTAPDDGTTWPVFIMNAANPDVSLTFPKAGIIPYHCQFHGAPGVGMYGIITVLATPLAVTPAQLATAPHAYPNPATAAVTLPLDQLPAGQPGTVQLLNMLGSLVRTVEVPAGGTGRELTLDVADLPAGLYAYRLLMGREVLTSQRLTVVGR